MLLHPAGARDGEGMRVVPAQEILDKIERGEPVEYDHVIVEGDLDLGKVDLPKIKMKRTYNENVIKYGNVIKLLFVDENTTMISSSIEISDSTVNGSISFDYSVFGNLVDFSGSTFKGIAGFVGSTFNGTADFMGSIFNHTAYFDLSAFNDRAEFQHSAFNDHAEFQGSAFNYYADFSGSAFNDEANFWYSDFNGTANFFLSTFNGDANFHFSAFDGAASFWDSDFNGDANFYRSAFNISDFNDSRFKEDAEFEGALFDGPLYLTRTKYDRLYIRWKNIKELGYDDAAYLSLLENFKKLGYVEDYDACYYEYRRLHRDQPWGGRYHAMLPSEERLLKRIDLGLQYFYGYGKKPLWPPLWSVGTILLFGLIWRKAGVDGGRGRGGIFERYGPQRGKLSMEEQLRALIGAMLFSATLFLSGTRLFVDPPAMPKLEGWLATYSRSFFIAERVLGAFFSILFFLAISGTVVR